MDHDSAAMNLSPAAQALYERTQAQHDRQRALRQPDVDACRGAALGGVLGVWVWVGAIWACKFIVGG